MSDPIFDLSLYLVVGRGDTRGRDLPQLIAEAVAGGVTLVQLREKALSDEAYAKLAQQVKAALKGTGTPLIINDRLDVALKAEADGLHLGQDDGELTVARAALGADRILGTSVGTPEEALCAASSHFNYAGVGPVYPTGTKSDAGVAIGLEGLGRIAKMLGSRIVAIGGVTAKNAAGCVKAGAEGVAVVSAIAAAPDPRAAALALRGAVESAKEALSTRDT